LDALLKSQKLEEVYQAFYAMAKRANSLTLAEQHQMSVLENEVRSLFVKLSQVKFQTVAEVAAHTGATTNRDINLALIAMTEHRIADIIRSGTSGLKPDVLKAVQELVQTYVPHSKNADEARGELISQINVIIGRQTLDAQAMIDATNLFSQQGSRGSIFEHWVRNYLGNVEGITLEDGKVKVKGVKGEANKSKNIMPDAVFYMEDGKVVVALEMKHVEGKLIGEPLQQLLRYAELVRNPEQYGFGGQTIEVRYIFSSKAAAEANSSRIFTELGDKASIYYLDPISNRIIELE
jgi:hypothetical protein